MKVYIAIGGWNYEGFGEPIGVYSTKELAQKALRSASGYDDKEVMEYDLDDAQVQSDPESTTQVGENTQ